MNRNLYNLQKPEVFAAYGGTSKFAPFYFSWEYFRLSSRILMPFLVHGCLYKVSFLFFWCVDNTSYVMRAQLENPPFRKLVSAHQSGAKRSPVVCLFCFWISRFHRRLLLELVLLGGKEGSGPRRHFFTWYPNHMPIYYGILLRVVTGTIYSICSYIIDVRPEWMNEWMNSQNIH